MFCGTTVDLMAKMMTAGRRLVSFWRTHSILEGSGQGHLARVPLALGSLLVPSPPSAPGVSPASQAEHGQLTAYLQKEPGFVVGRWWAFSCRLCPHSAPASAHNLARTTPDTSLPKPRSEPCPLGKTEAVSMMVSIITPEQKGWPLFLEQRMLV